MRTIVLIVFISFTGGLFSQEQTAAQLAREARNDLREGNKKFHQLQFDEAEIAYKKALSKNPAYSKAAYNLGNAVYEQGRNKEAIAQFEWLEKTLTDKVAKADVFHNKGNAFIKEKQYGPAVEAYKNALRNRPEDEETRYNLAMAQELLEDQQSQNKDQQNSQDNKDNKDQQQDQVSGEDDAEHGRGEKGQDRIEATHLVGGIEVLRRVTEHECTHTQNEHREEKRQPVEPEGELHVERRNPLPGLHDCLAGHHGGGIDKEQPGRYQEDQRKGVAGVAPQVADQQGNRQCGEADQGEGSHEHVREPPLFRLRSTTSHHG